jgi:hypothetical protein
LPAQPNTAGKITYYCTIHGKVQSGTVHGRSVIYAAILQ